MLLLTAFAVAVLASVVATPAVIRVATARVLLDVPADGRRVHTRPVPRLGGVAVFAAVALGLAAAALVEPPAAERLRFLGTTLAAGTFLFAVGLVDDLRGLRATTKLLAQLAAATAVYALGTRVGTLTVGPTASVDVGLLSFPLTALWIVGVTNAFNLIDGLDGLASGIALVVLGTVFAASVLLGRGDVTLVSVAMVGAVAGFLCYNVNPARIFLGDAGSLFLGFMLAVLSVHGSMKGTTALVAIVPLCALAVPLADMSVAITRRWLRGVPIFSADRNHLHHRLLAIGLTHRHAAAVLWTAALVIAGLGLALAFAPPRGAYAAALVGSALTVLFVLFGLGQLGYLEFREAGSVMLSGVVKIRRVIRDQITARELGDALAGTATLAEVNTVLAGRAESLGFTRIDVVLAGTPHDPVRDHAGGKLWRLEYPVGGAETARTELHVLRLWCDMTRGHRPYGAERISRVLGPVIESWLAARDTHVATVPLSLADARRSPVNVLPGTAAEPADVTPIRASRRSSYHSASDADPLPPHAAVG